MLTTSFSSSHLSLCFAISFSAMKPNKKEEEREAAITGENIKPLKKRRRKLESQRFSKLFRSITTTKASLQSPLHSSDLSRLLGRWKELFNKFPATSRLDSNNGQTSCSAPATQQRCPGSKAAPPFVTSMISGRDNKPDGDWPSNRWVPATELHMPGRTDAIYKPPVVHVTSVVQWCTRHP